jgi:hypothetical protein
MKKFLHDLAVCGAVCAATVGLMAGFEGCSTNTVTTASTVNGVLVLGVDGSMQGWALYVNGNTNVPDSEILAVSNLYSAYYSGEVALSNAFTAYAASPGTNTQAVVTAASSTVGTVGTNLISAIKAYSVTTK